jgi:hypothetical protein
MSTNQSASDVSPAVGCFAECPYFRSVAGSCSHDLNQTLLKQFTDDPEATCPIYTEWRAEEMATLARHLESNW